MLTLRTVVQDRPMLAGLRTGAVRIPGVTLDFDQSVTPVHKAFGPMAERQEFDVCEMAIATYVQARAMGRPIELLPVTLAGKFQHGKLHRSPGFDGAPKDLEGGRVAVRSYSQTSGVWVRAFLRLQYGVDLDAVEWTVFEDPHVSGLRLPKNVRRAPAGRTLTDVFTSGEVRAAIGVKDESRATTLLPDPDESAHDWYVLTGIVPVNHVLTVSRSVLDQHPDAVREVFHAFRHAVANRAGGGRSGGGDVKPEWSRGVDVLPTGVRSLEPILDRLADENYRQGLIPEQLAVEDLIHPDVRAWDANA